MIPKQFIAAAPGGEPITQIGSLVLHRQIDGPGARTRVTELHDRLLCRLFLADVKQDGDPASGTDQRLHERVR